MRTKHARDSEAMSGLFKPRGRKQQEPVLVNISLGFLKDGRDADAPFLFI